MADAGETIDLRFTIGLFFAILGVILLVSVALPGGSHLSLYAGGVYLAFAAFVAAIAAVLFAERHLRALGDEALRQVSALRRNATGARRGDPPT